VYPPTYLGEIQPSSGKYKHREVYFTEDY